jgi:hypothetical protein
MLLTRTATFCCLGIYLLQVRNDVKFPHPGKGTSRSVLERNVTRFRFVFRHWWVLQSLQAASGPGLLNPRERAPIKKKLHGLSPRANYTDRATAACRRSDWQLFADRWCHVVSVSDLYRTYSRFSRQEPLLFYQVAPQLYSRGWVDPVPDPLLFFILVVPEIEPGHPEL